MMNKGRLAVLLALLQTVVLSGCKELKTIKTNEIDEHLFIRAIGIDKTESDSLLLTLSSADLSTMQNGEFKPQLVSAQGRTLFEANRNIGAFANRDLFWAHAVYAVIDEAIAQEDIHGVIDFLIRDHEIRLSFSPVIVKGSTAEEVLHKTAETGACLCDVLDNVFDNSKDLSFSSNVSLLMMEQLESTLNCAYLPCIELKEGLIARPYQQGIETRTEQNVVLTGYAVFDENQLTGYLTQEQGRGLNWLINQIASGVVPVKNSRGEWVSLEIIQADCELIPTLTEDGCEVEVRLTFSTNINEELGEMNLFTEQELDFLTQQQEAEVRKEIQEVIDFSIAHNVDITGICSKLKHQSPKQWEAIKDQWDAWYPQTRFKVVIDSKIERVYSVKEAEHLEER